MTDFSFLPDDSEFAKENSKTTPYDVLDQCKAILEDRGRLRDSNNNILEHSFTQAVEIANSVFYGGQEKISELTIMEVLIAIKIARMSSSIRDGRKDFDSLYDLICYLSFYIAELKNNT